MARKLDDSELVNLIEFIKANSIQIDAGIQLFIEKEFVIQDEFFIEAKQDQSQYQNSNQSERVCLKTVDEVVDEIIAELTLAEKVATADLNENEFRVLELTLGKLIRYKLDRLDVDVNKELMKDCVVMSGESLNEVDAATVIIKELWKRLRESHKLRIVK